MCPRSENANGRATAGGKTEGQPIKEFRRVRPSCKIISISGFVADHSVATYAGELRLPMCTPAGSRVWRRRYGMFLDATEGASVDLLRRPPWRPILATDHDGKYFEHPPQAVRPRSLVRDVWDLVGIPARLLLFDQRWLPYFGWTTLEQSRFDEVLPLVRGTLLDVGAGANNLVKRYGNGVGVDVHDWGGGTVVIENSGSLPFDDATFDTVTFVACLNHIPQRAEALREAHRVLRDGGRLIITMINPILGGLGHAIWWYSEDKKRGGMQAGEVGGMWAWDVIRVTQEAGFALTLHRRFLYRMNELFVFRRA